MKIYFKKAKNYFRKRKNMNESDGLSIMTNWKSKKKNQNPNKNKKNEK